jgi:hypothetical protein
MHQNKKKAQRLYAEDFNQSSNLTNSKHYNLENRKLNRLLFTKINNKIKTDPTSMNWYLQKKIIKRHSLHITNLWWTGQLPEHNKEITFLSDIDWRILSRLKDKKEIVEKANESLNKIKTNSKLTKTKSLLSSDGRQDFVASFVKNELNSTKNIQEKDSNNSISLFNYIIDFPDSEQYYNPKERRWMLSYGYYSFWFDIEMAGNNYSIDKYKHSLNFDVNKVNKQKRTEKGNYKTLSLLSSDARQDFVENSIRKELSESFYNYYNIEKEDQQKYLLFYYFLNNNRELLDLFTYHLIEKGLIKEVFFIRHKIKI